MLSSHTVTEIPLPSPIEEREKDKTLIHRIKARDPRAVGELYDAYGRIAYSVIFRAVRDAGVAEDLTQETFLRAWTSIQSFDATRGGLATWILTIARNRAIDYLRSSNFRMTQQAVDLESAGERSLMVEPEDSVMNLDRARILNRAMTGLSGAQRTLLNLSYCEGLSHSEIASRTRQPLGTVKTRIRSALLTMRAQIESAC